MGFSPISKYCQTPIEKCCRDLSREANRLLGQIFSRLQLGITRRHQQQSFISTYFPYYFLTDIKKRSTRVTWGKRTEASSRKSTGLFTNQMQYTFATSALNTQLNVKHLARARSVFWIILTSIILTQALFSKFTIGLKGKTTTSSDALTSLQI